MAVSTLVAISSARTRYAFLVGFWLLGLLLRVAAIPEHNRGEDAFEVIGAARYLLETGHYQVPKVGSQDLQVHYSSPGWPVGFPLFLATVFRFLGSADSVARFVTACLSSLVIPFSMLVAEAWVGRQVVLLTGLLLAVHPVLVGFGSQVYTVNAALPLYLLALALILASLSARQDGIAMVPFEQVLTERSRFVKLMIGAWVIGLNLSVRDTDLLLYGVFALVMWQAGAFQIQCPFNREWLWVRVKLFAGMAVCVVIGWSPGLYFNWQNFGTPFVSTHMASGWFLDLGYFLLGVGSPFHVPGLLLQVFAVVIYTAPSVLACIASLPKPDASMRLLCTACGLMVLPIVVISGAFAVGPYGAVVRYVLPLMPFASIILAYVLVGDGSVRSRGVRGVIFAGFLVWQLLLTYVPPAAIQVFPSLAYLTYYSPVYGRVPYINYPDHVAAVASWVKTNTPSDSVVLAGSALLNMYYYGERPVVYWENVTPSSLQMLMIEHPVYVVEGHDSLANPSRLERLRATTAEAGFEWWLEGQVPLFSPRVGLTYLKMYRVQHQFSSS